MFLGVALDGGCNKIKQRRFPRTLPNFQHSRPGPDSHCFKFALERVFSTLGFRAPAQFFRVQILRRVALYASQRGASFLKCCARLACANGLSVENRSTNAKCDL